MSVKDNKSDLTRLARFDPEYWFLRSAGRAKPVKKMFTAERDR